MSIKSLIINPGSTSTKIGVFEDETLLFEETLRHSTEEIASYATIVDQKDFRKNIIVSLLKDKNFDINSLNVVVGRGGMLKPIVSGTYAVSDALLADLKVGVQGQHASNLGGILAREIGDSIGVPSYIVDPVVVDELMPHRADVFGYLEQECFAQCYSLLVSFVHHLLDIAHIVCPEVGVETVHKNRGSQNYGSPCFYHYKCNINFPLRPFKFERRHNPIPRFHCPRTVWFPDSSPLWQYSRFVPKKFPILTAPVTATVKLPLPIIDHQPRTDPG